LFSGGVGRTGTFIAIDALHEHGHKTGYIDIMEYVQMMRKDRMNMIQTKVSLNNRESGVKHHYLYPPLQAIAVTRIG
jgi:protein tyrosine phosphatase